MFIFTLIGIAVVVIALVYFFNSNSNSGSSGSSSSSYNTGSSYSPVGQTRKIPVLTTPIYPTLSSAYKKHFPIIRNSVFKAFDEMHYWNYVSREDVEDEITCFMIYTALALANEEQKHTYDDLIQEIHDFRLTAAEVESRIMNYQMIFLGASRPRVDWGKPISKYNYMNDEKPMIRCFCAFGDYLINPECRSAYFEAPPMNNELVIFSIGFESHFCNEIFEKYADYTQCFPSQLRYAK